MQQHARRKDRDYGRPSGPAIFCAMQRIDLTHTRAPQPVRGLWRQQQQPDAAVQTRPPACNCNLPDPFCN